MEALKQDLKGLGTEDEREAFARRCGTSLGHMRNVIYSKPPTEKTFAPALAVSIERESGRVVRRWDLRPADWSAIWPELIDAEAPATGPGELAA